jgi:D-sedoheptulose 7-phosphate isomerase
MSLSNTSLAFLRELYKALEGVEIEGAWLPHGKIFLIGNGGSAAIASHIANDLVKLGYDAATPNYATLTCLANDYGWEHALWRMIRGMVIMQLVIISSSGKSQNLLNCVDEANIGEVITITGFDADNPLRKEGDINYWVPSHNYGIVECAHLALLHSIVNPGEL